MDIYKKAAIKKLRFSTVKGNLTVEDLWDLPMKSSRSVSLDLVAQNCDADLNKKTKSFISAKTEDDALAQLRMDIVLDVIKTRLDNLKAKDEQQATNEHNKRIDELIKAKEHNELASKSIEELKALKK